MTHGARPDGSGSWVFDVWAPTPESIALVLEGPVESVHRMERDERGRASVRVEGLAHGQRYRWEIDGRRRPDPGSRWQPDGVHGASALVDPHRWSWTDDGWTGYDSLAGQVLYELHVGAFTPDGTFDAAAGQLGRLAAVGVTSIELMPIAQFPGAHNWGYDGVLPWAVQDSYGGPEGLARLVDAAHAAGLGVILDVVHNHFGPEGNHLREFGPYFTDTYVTPWGDAVNVSEAGSDEVRALFVDSARAFVREHHVDGFRLDAVHAIVDPTARPFLEELTEAVHAEAESAGRRALVIAESSDNDPRLVRSPARGGFGMDGVWQDEIHHAIRVAVTGERPGYYADFSGAADIAHALQHRVVFDGRYSPARRRRHGRPADDVPAHRYVVCDQNHDQVGNRAFGERLDVLVDPERRRVAAAVVALGPFTPMLFMGEEYGETAPFPYFVDHTDPALLEAVRRGRRREFAAFDWDVEPPDPAAESTFRSAVLDPTAADPSVAELWRSLLTARRDHPVLWQDDAETTTSADGGVVTHHRSGDGEVFVLWNLGPGATAVTLPGSGWRHVVSTGPEDPSDPSGTVRIPPWSASLFARP